MYRKQDLNYHIHINSKDRVNKNDPPNILKVRISDIISLNSRERIYISCPYVNLPPCIPNISTFGQISAQHYNNKLTFIEDSVPTGTTYELTISLPNGNYNILNFESALTTAMSSESFANGYGNVYTSTYDGVTGKLTIAIVGSPANRTFTYMFYGENQDLKNFLGFSNEYNDLSYARPITDPNYSLTSPNVVNFTGSYPAVYVRCNRNRSDNAYDTHDGLSADQGGNSDILQIVPIPGNGFSQISYQDYEGITDRRIEINTLLNRDIILYLTSDDKQLPVDLNGMDWQVDLLVQYSNETK